MNHIIRARKIDDSIPPGIVLVSQLIRWFLAPLQLSQREAKISLYSVGKTAHHFLRFAPPPNLSLIG
jgi:hypothetical protein